MNGNDVDIAIVGGSLVGACLARALAPRWRVALIEPKPPLIPASREGFDQRVYAISPGNRDYLRGLGAWPSAVDSATAIRKMWVAGDGSSHIAFDALDLAADELATIVENRQLQAAMWQSLPDTVLCLPHAVHQAKFLADNVDLTLGNQQLLRCQLAVAADGANSPLRESAGITFRRQPYHQHGVVANFTTARAHSGTARQWFRHDGILAWLPLPGQRVSMVWSCSDALAQELLSLSLSELAQRVAAAGSHALGDMTTITSPAAFPLALGSASTMIAPRLALVGDAAHTIHPLAGQGVNLGFGDARELAAVLSPARVSDPGAAEYLSTYQRHRAEEVFTMQSLCDGLQKLFASPDPLLTSLRNIGLNLTDSAGPIKRRLMQHAFK
jgi:2-polyprenylphenol 6-hydroxylase